MPVRRHSGVTSSPKHTDTPAQRFRSHFSPSTPGSMQEEMGGRAEASGSTGQQQVVAALVGRLMNKLPCHSGTRLAIMEADGGFKVTVQSLLQMSKIRLGLVVQAMTGALETLLKYSSATSLPDTPLDTLQSQGFMLHILFLCLSSSWRFDAEKHAPPTNSLPQCWPDPVPMEESQARNLLSIVLLYARMVSVAAGSGLGTASPAQSREGRGTSPMSTSSSSWDPSSTPNSSGNWLGAKFLQRHCFPSGSTSIPPIDPKCFAFRYDTTDSTIKELTKRIARIVFFLSSANWAVALSRLKSRIGHLTTTIEEKPDLVDFRLLEWSNLNRGRLGQVLQEISTAFLNVKRPAQVAIASTIRRGIWNWIDAHPLELEILIESKRKIEGADILFDVLHSMSDISSSSNSRRTRTFYPLMAMLLVLCPDIMQRTVVGDMGTKGGGGLAKKSRFLDSLRKGISTPKGFEPCVLCYVNLFLAATAVSPGLGSSGVRSLAADVQNDVKNALFYSSLAGEISDVDILIDGLTTLYRINQDNTVKNIFPRLLADSNEKNRTVAVRALWRVVVEGARLPWYSSISDLRRDVAPGVRAAFRTCVTTVLGNTSAVRRPGASPDLRSNQVDLISGIFTLLALDPAFIHTGITSDPSDSLRSTMNAISSLMVSPSPGFVRSMAANVGVAFLRHLSMLPADTGTALLASSLDSIWRIYLDAARQQLFAIHAGDEDDVAKSYDISKDVGLAMTSVTEHHPDAFSGSEVGSRAVLLNLISIITALVSPDFEHLSQSAQTFQSLSKLTLVAHRDTLPADSQVGPKGIAHQIMMRVKLLEALSSLPPATGRQHQQRQSRKTFRPFAVPTPWGIAIWTGLAAVAKTVTSKIIAAEADSTPSRYQRRGLTDIEGLDEGQSKTWQNVLLFLCSTARICSHDETPPPRLSDAIGKGLLPRVYDDEFDTRELVETFIRECVDLLASHSVFVRETIKEGLGSELPVDMTRIMVSQMTKLLSHSLGSTGISTSETFTSLVDQIIAILRLSFERMGRSEIANGLRLDFGELASLLTSYVHRLGRDEGALRMKARYCQLVEVALSKEGVSLSNGGQLRNTLLDSLMDWSVVEAPREPDAYHNGLRGGSQSQEELDRACLRVMVPVTEGLVLESGTDEMEQSQTAVKSRMFYRIYQHLVRVLERAHLYENEFFDPSSLAEPSGLRLSYEDPTSLAILSLSNLLSANIDVGLKHCLALGYHEDPTLRSGFMQLLTNVLRQGTRFGGLNVKRSSPKPKPYLEALTGNANNMALAIAICEVCGPSEIDEISTLLFRVFEARGTLINLAKLLVDREVAMTNRESELFRGNSISTRLLTNFARSYGYNYIRATLQPFVHILVGKPAECSFELDPAKASATDDIDRNMEDLQMIGKGLLDLICASAARAPVMFKALCHHIWEVVEDRFPDSRHSAVGSFIFLRFFCPAIVAPESIDLDVSPDTKEVRRALLLITKIVQNLASNVTFKEAHMKGMNGFLADNIRQVTRFSSEMAVRPRSWEMSSVIKVHQEDADRSRDEDEADEALLHRFLNKHAVELETSLSKIPSTFRRPLPGRPQKVDFNGLDTLHRLKDKIAETGMPGISSDMNASARSQMYDDFMRPNVGRNVNSVVDAFYEGPASQNGRRIFYFIVSRIALVDYDLLAYHVFSILENITDFFDLIIDLTGFCASTELPMTWLKRSIQMCPPGILPCITTLVLYNPNQYAQKRVRRIITELLTVAPPAGKHLVAASSPAEMAEFIPFTSLALPDYTMTLAYEAEHVFTNLLALGDHERQIPVVVKLGYDCMQVASWRKQDLTSTVKSYIIDVISLIAIDDIITGGTLPQDHLLIKYSQTESVTFVSRKRAEMAQIIRAARARLRVSPSEERSLRPSDVPGTLLNVALLNLSSTDELLRTGAYHLINELARFFKYDLPSKLTASVSVPMTSLSFVYEISRSLATSAPHLTPEFLKEWTIGFTKADLAQKIASLHYVEPWLRNLETWANPSRDEGVEGVKQAEEIVKSLIVVTMGERRRLHLLIRERVWSVLADGHEALIDILVAELLHTAVDAGIGSEKAECAAEILVSVSSTVVRGRVIARLRKLIAQTYLNPSLSLTENTAWSEISVLTRICFMLSSNPPNPVDTQLFLPELLHIIPLLMSCGSVLMRLSVYGLTVNVVQSLATAPTIGEMETSTLAEASQILQSEAMIGHFGLMRNPHSTELSGLPQKSEADEGLLNAVEKVATFLGDVLAAGAVSIDCANAWRARWMGLVAATCFQHNPATQPQAFTVLGYLASDEVDDDLVYQILVAMGTTISRFSETGNILIVSMLRCLSRVVPGLLPDSRNALNLFWLAVGILQLGYVPLFAGALNLALVALRAIGPNLAGESAMDVLLDGRAAMTETAAKLDQACGVSFETDPAFSFVSIIFKGFQQPSTRLLTVEVMMEMLKLVSTGEGGNLVTPAGVPFFIALLPVVAGSISDLRDLFQVARLDKGYAEDLATFSTLRHLSLPDNSTALLLITLVVTMLNTASSEVEKNLLYRLLAEASAEMPEVMSMVYDTLIPRMTAVLATASSTPIITAITVIMERAMTDPTYTFPSTLIPSESMSSLHAKSYNGSISSAPSMGGISPREGLLDDLGMRGLSELNFVTGKADRIIPMAKWIAAMIESFTV